MSRCKTGWRIVCIPFGGKPWAAVHDRSNKTYICKTWSAAFACVVEATRHLAVSA